MKKGRAPRQCILSGPHKFGVWCARVLKHAHTIHTKLGMQIHTKYTPNTHQQQKGKRMEKGRAGEQQEYLQRVVAEILKTGMIRPGKLYFIEVTHQAGCNMVSTGICDCFPGITLVIKPGEAA